MDFTSENFLTYRIPILFLGQTGLSPEKKNVAELLSLKKEIIKNDDSIVNDLDADSIASEELLMALEKEFDVEISDKESEKITTVQSIIDFIKINLNSG